MSLCFDHLLIAVGDLDEAAENWRQLGFTVSPRMHHSYGTSNHLIMFRDNFLELFGGMENVPADRTEFVEDLAASLEKGEGVLASSFRPDDTVADRAMLVEQGVEMTEVGEFTRPVPLPNGAMGEAHISFSFSNYPQADDFRLFLSQQHRPEVVWIPEWQEHPNGAIRLTSVTWLARDPMSHERLFTSFAGCGPSIRNPELLEYETPGGRLTVTQADEGFERASEVTIQVASLDPVRKFLPVVEANGLKVRFHL